MTKGRPEDDARRLDRRDFYYAVGRALEGEPGKPVVSGKYTVTKQPDPKA